MDTKQLLSIDLSNLILDENEILNMNYYAKHFLKESLIILEECGVYNRDKMPKVYEGILFNRIIEEHRVYRIVHHSHYFPDIFVYTLKYKGDIYAIPLYTKNTEEDFPLLNLQIKDEISIETLIFWSSIQLPSIAYGEILHESDIMYDSFKEEVFNVFKRVATDPDKNHQHMEKHLILKEHFRLLSEIKLFYDAKEKKVI